MVTGIIGRKVGMTQVFDADGTVHPATVIKAGPCVVVQAKNAQTDGYEAVQLGLVEETPAKANKPTGGALQEGERAADARAPRGEAGGGRRGAEGRRPGARRRSSPTASASTSSAPSRGKGFQGVVKRHHFARRRGDARLDVPSRAGIDRRLVVSRRASSRGCAPAGRMGGDRVTMRNLKVLRVDADNHLLIVEGGIPGAPSGYVVVRKAVTAKKLKVRRSRSRRRARSRQEVGVSGEAES